MLQNQLLALASMAVQSLGRWAVFLFDVTVLAFCLGCYLQGSFLRDLSSSQEATPPCLCPRMLSANRLL